MRISNLLAATFCALSAPNALAGALLYTFQSGQLSYGPPGPAGQYVLGGVTHTISSSATVTYTATADSTAVISGVTSADSGSNPIRYNLVSSIAVSIVDGSTTTGLTISGTQVVGSHTFSTAVLSMKAPDDSYSVLGFAVIDASAPYSATSPFQGGLGWQYDFGTTFFNDLASVGTSSATLASALTPNPITVVSGGQSGTLQFFNGGVNPTFTISSVPAPGAIALLGMVGMVGRRRR